MKRLIQIIALLALTAPAWGQVTPPAFGAYYLSGGAWTPAPTTGSSLAIGFTPTAIAMYCYNSSLGQWVAADSSCFGGSSGTFNALTGDATSTATGGATTVKGINGQLLSALSSCILYNTTTTGVPSCAVSANVISLFSGSCSSSTFLRGDGSCAAAGGGAVTSIATTSPITGGTITTTGTIACPTCVTSAASLTSNALMTGAGSQGSQTVTTGTGVLTALGNAVNATGGHPTIQNCQAITASSGAATVNWASGNCAVVTCNSGASSCAVTLSNPVSGVTYYLGLINNATPNTWTFSPTPNQLKTPIYASEGVYGVYAYDGSAYQGTGSNATATVIYGSERSAPATSASGAFVCWWDSTNHVMTCNDNASGTNEVMPLVKASRTANQFVTNIDATGTQNTAAIALADLPALTNWQTPYTGNTGVFPAQANNTVTKWGFTLNEGDPVTFSHIYLIGQTTDASGLYSFAIVNAAGTPVCHVTTAYHITSGLIIDNGACAEGSVTALPNTVYYIAGTGNATTGKVNASSGVLVDAYVASDGTCPSSGGVISGNCAATSQSIALPTASVPWFKLH